MRVYVRYIYPIYAEVDLDEQDVMRVVVDDEHPSQPVEVLDGSFRGCTEGVEGSGDADR